MSPEHRKLARDALGLPNKKRSTTRNVGYASADSDRHASWLAMTQLGLATRQRGYNGMLDMFRLTPDGAHKALDDGEALDKI